MSINTRLAIVCSHPIQYYCPVFKLLATSVDLKVFYTKRQGITYDKGFRKDVQWDIPLLEGYPYEFLSNVPVVNSRAVDKIQQYDPQYLLIYGWAYYSHLKILNHFKGKIKILFRGDSTLLKPRSPIYAFLKKGALRYIYGHVDIALYVGSNNQTYYKNYGLRDSQLIFCPHSIDNDRFGRKVPGISVRAQLKLRPKDILILFTGKFIPLKNPGLLLRVFCQLDIPGIHLLMVGEGPLYSGLKQKYTRQNIHFLPFQNQQNMPQIYQACDLFCMPSQSESWGLALNEAMAAGKAVLSQIPPERQQTS